MQEAVAGVKSYKESVELQSETDAHTHIKAVQSIYNRKNEMCKI